jgi:hypothetical protein
MNKRTLGDFKDSLSLPEPPPEFTRHEKALWYAGKGDWEKAHQIVQDMDDRSAAQIHAFLHRQEGDLSNARYWYQIASSQIPAVSLDEEWELLVTRL